MKSMLDVILFAAVENASNHHDLSIFIIGVVFGLFLNIFFGD